MKYLSRLAWEWGVRCFGLRHMTNKSIRTLRLVEEAVELAQCYDVDPITLHKLIDTVYSRPVGNPLQELGGVLVTTAVLCETIGRPMEDVMFTEVSRCLAKSSEHFAKRNQEKIDLGLTA